MNLPGLPVRSAGCAWAEFRPWPVFSAECVCLESGEFFIRELTRIVIVGTTGICVGICSGDVGVGVSICDRIDGQNRKW